MGFERFFAWFVVGAVVGVASAVGCMAGEAFGWLTLALECAAGAGLCVVAAVRGE